MRISDWSSDVCSSDLLHDNRIIDHVAPERLKHGNTLREQPIAHQRQSVEGVARAQTRRESAQAKLRRQEKKGKNRERSEESRVGNERVSTGRSRRSPHTYKKNTYKKGQDH